MRSITIPGDENLHLELLKRLRRVADERVDDLRSEALGSYLR